MLHVAPKCVVLERVATSETAEIERIPFHAASSHRSVEVEAFEMRALDRGLY